MTESRLLVLNGTLQGQTIIVRSPMTIGRNPDNDIFLDDPQVSRRHAQITTGASGTVVRDLGSGNGTYVEGRRIVEGLLRDGDVVQVGNVRMQFEVSKTDTLVRFEERPAIHVEASDAANVFATFFESQGGEGRPGDWRDAQSRLTALYKANAIISTERDIHRLFERVMDQLFALVPAHNGVILLRDEKTGGLETAYVKSGSGSAVISMSIVNRALDCGEAIITFDAADDSRFGMHGSIIAQNIASAMCAPLVHQNERLGVLYVDTRGTPNAFDHGDLELLVAFAGPAAIAIRNVRYLAQLEQAYHDTLIVTSNAVEMRDHYTVGHTWRVTNFAIEIAKTLGWAEEKIQECEMGGVLHDVGKIGVDDAILRKTEALTDEEFEKMKVHPERGARMLQDVERLRPLIPYCLYHHERYDGQGYPLGLIGEDIPIEGRIIAVADTFDAMTSNRPYRKGLPPEAAIEALIQGRGTQFDPLIVDAFLTCYREGRIIRVMQEYLKGEKSIACPFCSTYIRIPDGAKPGDEFGCTVCHRHVQLCMKNEAYYGILVSLSNRR